MRKRAGIERQITAFGYDLACAKMGIALDGQINPAQLSHRLTFLQTAFKFFHRFRIVINHPIQ
ncbi:hypothetical protein CEV32_4118 [Brucella rhizosphaerae]|uniref:Uncharacterized protein n=1 Tax=Brucella rhizosphaerae TaxID=571254 RepID=A0A256FPL8_9HYPH|nr:hypothetical protein CEV32_4118 [Brucella rhizosphaerae]